MHEKKKPRRGLPAQKSARGLHSELLGSRVSVRFTAASQGSHPGEWEREARFSRRHRVVSQGSTQQAWGRWGLGLGRRARIGSSGLVPVRRNVLQKLVSRRRSRNREVAEASPSMSARKRGVRMRVNGGPTLGGHTGRKPRVSTGAKETTMRRHRAILIT